MNIGLLDCTYSTDDYYIFSINLPYLNNYWTNGIDDMTIKIISEAFYVQ